MSNPLKKEIRDDVMVLTIDVPGKPMNVVTPDLRESLRGAVAELTESSELKGAVVTSVKKDFMAGGDLKAMLERFNFSKAGVEIYEESKVFGEIIRGLETCGKPVVAAINGLALGGGFELALACHYRIVADVPGLVLGLPEATLGLMPGAGGTQRVSRMIGAEAAIPLLQAGKSMAPQKALALGLIDEIVSADQLLSRAVEWVLKEGDPVQRWEQDDYQVPGGSQMTAPGLVALYNGATVKQAVGTKGNRPAPLAIVTAVARGLALPVDAGLRVERQQFVSLLMNPVTRNFIRTQFVNKGEAEKLARRPKKIEPLSYQKVAVLGAGLMGAGIAQVAALAGIEAVLLDISLEAAEAGVSRIRSTFDKGIARGKVKADKADKAMALIQATCNYADLAGCQLVVEAVSENRDIKNRVFEAVYEVLGDEAIYCSNTSRLPITGLAEAVGSPEQFIGTHFFSPVDRMALVEVIKGEQTSEKTLAHTLDFVKAIRKVPVLVNDSRGFFTTRIFSTYLNEANAMIEDGINPALIENGAKLAGFPVGPLALMDEVSQKLTYEADKQNRADLGDAWTENASWRVRKHFVDVLDRCGRRFGAGYYEYPSEGGKHLWQGFADNFLPMDPQPSVEDVKKRFLYIQALEAVRAYEDGVLEDISEGDVAATLGIGYPAYTGGPFSLIDTVGVREFVNTCERFAGDFGERWQPTPGLLKRAETDSDFYAS